MTCCRSVSSQELIQHLGVIQCTQKGTHSVQFLGLSWLRLLLLGSLLGATPLELFPQQPSLDMSVWCSLAFCWPSQFKQQNAEIVTFAGCISFATWTMQFFLTSCQSWQRCCVDSCHSSYCKTESRVLERAQSINVLQLLRLPKVSVQTCFVQSCKEGFKYINHCRFLLITFQPGTHVATNHAFVVRLLKCFKV